MVGESNGSEILASTIGETNKKEKSKRMNFSILELLEEDPQLNMDEEELEAAVFHELVDEGPV